ncbi:MAG: phosphoribosylanthranilate isomerase, partial [Thermodesulfobacteriota bacterium]
AVALGADALGLVSDMPSGPGPIPDELIARIAAVVPPPVATFLLTCRTEGPDIVAHLLRCRTNTVQLVDAADQAVYTLIHRELPWIRIVQVVHVLDETALDEAAGVAPFVDALLLDSGNPGLEVKELGGTGRVHDWEISRRIVAEVDRPVFLAGGLRPDNVARAVGRVRPYGIDLCTGVRTGGRLDLEKLAAVTKALAAADLGDWGWPAGGDEDKYNE